MMEHAELVRRLDGRISHRTIDRWHHSGVIVIGAGPRIGSGRRREYTEAEFRAIRRMCDERDFIHRITEHFASGALWAAILAQETDED